MKGDFSRLRFSPNKNYTSVLQQQGRVALDSDSNEQCAIDDYLRDTETIDVVGVVGGPIHDEGFGIGVQGGAIQIGKGRYYVEGLLCENPRPLAYSDQPFLIDPSPTDQDLLTDLQNGKITAIQVYLEVWQRLVTALDDPCLREPAIGQADTTARLQTVARVVAKGVTTAFTNALTGTVSVLNGTSAVIGVGISFTTQLKVGDRIVFASDPAQAYTISAIESDTQLTLAANYTGPNNQSTTVSLAGSTGACCKSMHTGPIRVPGEGKLNAKTGAGSGDCSCQPTPAAGYRGLENQLYRVEIHHEGDESTATFKWSRENGSVVVAVTGVSGSKVTVDSFGPDANLGFASGQWVEISDDSDLFGEDPNQPGALYLIQSVDPTTLTVTMSKPVAWVNPSKNARMRRWDQFGASAGPNGVGVSTALQGLENGIEVEFSAGQYKSGDYWLIPARTATGQIEWPPCNGDGRDFQPPQRMEIFLAPLACIQWDSQTGAKPQDCRKPFYPLTELSPSKSATCCTYRVGTGGDFLKIQDAIDALPPEGGEVCILPGFYSEHVRIAGRRDVVIHGCGWQTRVASPALASSGTSNPAESLAPGLTAAVNNIAAVFTIIASRHIELRSFAVEAADDEAGILIDSTGTSLNELQVRELKLLRVLLEVTDVTIEDLVLTAATFPAILAQQARLLRIDRNRVAMKNVQSAWPAIFASGDEIHIDQNWVGIQSVSSVSEWLPYTVSQDLSGAPAGAATTGASAPGLSTTATTQEFVDASGLNLITIELPVHPGGIQIGGGSANVYVMENEIQGGSFNGITLGGVDVLDASGKNTGIWPGLITTITSGECDCTSTLQISGLFPGGRGFKVVAGGILAGVQICRNSIQNMGLCGIGPVGFFDLTSILEIITITGLEITANTISRTLLGEIAAAAESNTSIGYGAICVPDVQGLIVRDNTITDFGSAPAAGGCGIFVLHGEMIEISRNRVLETRDWTNAGGQSKATTQFGLGGIFIFLASPPAFPQPVDPSVWFAPGLFRTNSVLATPVYEPGLPAVRVEHNVVRVPLAYALAILGWGPFSIVNNHLSCGGLVSTQQTLLAQTVVIINFGTAIEFATPTRPTKLWDYAFNASAAAPSANFKNVSTGAVLFSNNICQLESTASGQREGASVFILTPDHLIFSNNHCWLDASQVSAFADALLIAFTLNVTSNRFQESPVSVLFSALTVGVVNITQQNIGTFCIIVLGMSFLDQNLTFAQKEICTRWEEVFRKLTGL